MLRWAKSHNSEEQWMPVKNTNNGSASEPYLRLDINAGNYEMLPDFSEMANIPEPEKYRKIREAGFCAVQGGNDDLARAEGLKTTGGGRVDKVGDADRVAAGNKERGHNCATLHVGTGFEDDDEIYRLVEDIITASIRHDFPLYIETHRATITQDMWRTVKFTEKLPEVRFNGDFSHWYTGLEMVYGDLEAKFRFLQPVFDRVRYIHGRIGNPGCIQVDIGDGKGRSYVDHFREMWTRSFMGFLQSAQPGDYISFTPELLHPEIYYARVFPNAQGELVEEGDRWTQALLYAEIAKEAFAEASRRLG